MDNKQTVLNNYSVNDQHNTNNAYLLIKVSQRAKWLYVIKINKYYSGNGQQITNIAQLFKTVFILTLLHNFSDNGQKTNKKQ